MHMKNICYLMILMTANNNKDICNLGYCMNLSVFNLTIYNDLKSYMWHLSHVVDVRTVRFLQYCGNCLKF